MNEALQAQFAQRWQCGRGFWGGPYFSALPWRLRLSQAGAPERRCPSWAGRVARREQHGEDGSEARATHGLMGFSWLTGSAHVPGAPCRWKRALLSSRLGGKSRISEQESTQSVPVTAGRLKAH